MAKTATHKVGLQTPSHDLFTSRTQSVGHFKVYFILHHLLDLFIPAPTRLLWEGFSHAAITAQRLDAALYKNTPLPFYASDVKELEDTGTGETTQ